MLKDSSIYKELMYILKYNISMKRYTKEFYITEDQLLIPLNISELSYSKIDEYENKELINIKFSCEMISDIKKTKIQDIELDNEGLKITMTDREIYFPYYISIDKPNIPDPLEKDMEVIQFDLLTLFENITPIYYENITTIYKGMIPSLIFTKSHIDKVTIGHKDYSEDYSNLEIEVKSDKSKITTYHRYMVLKLI